MRFMSGGDLRQLLKENPPWSDRLEQLASVMRDLQNIHKAGFVHKDFHSGNILWTHDEFQNYELCISDFGLSGPSNDKEDKLLSDTIYGTRSTPRPTKVSSIRHICLWHSHVGIFFGTTSLFWTRQGWIDVENIVENLRPKPVEGTMLILLIFSWYILSRLTYFLSFLQRSLKTNSPLDDFGLCPLVYLFF